MYKCVREALYSLWQAESRKIDSAPTSNALIAPRYAFTDTAASEDFADLASSPAVGRKPNPGAPSNGGPLSADAAAVTTAGLARAMVGDTAHGAQPLAVPRESAARSASASAPPPPASPAPRAPPPSIHDQPDRFQSQAVPCHGACVHGQRLRMIESQLLPRMATVHRGLAEKLVALESLIRELTALMPAQNA